MERLQRDREADICGNSSWVLHMLARSVLATALRGLLRLLEAWWQGHSWVSDCSGEGRKELWEDIRHRENLQWISIAIYHPSVPKLPPESLTGDVREREGWRV